MNTSIAQRALADFWRSASIVTSACAGAAGWSVEIHDAQAASSPSVLLYVWDSASGWTWLCSVPRKAFAAVSGKASRERPAMVEAIRGKPGQQHGMLRPFTLSAETCSRDVLPIKNLLDAVRVVQKMDRERHPEWFV